MNQKKQNEFKSEYLQVLFKETSEGASLTQCAQVLGLTSVQVLQDWIKKNPEVAEIIKDAREVWCDKTECGLEHLLDKYPNTKDADLMFRVNQFQLAVRMPQRYSPKMDITMNQNISIQSNIASANDRLNGLMRNVVEITSELIDKPKEIDK